MDNNALILALVIAIVGAIPPTMVAYSSLQQSKKNAEKTEENTELTKATQVKVEEVGEQTKEIHTATNGTLSKFEGRVEEQTKEIAELRAVLKSMVERETAAAPVRAANVRQTGELIEKVGNGNTASYDKLIAQVEELKEILAGFADKGMPVIAEGAPLPVVAVKPSEVKK